MVPNTSLAPPSSATLAIGVAPVPIATAVLMIVQLCRPPTKKISEPLITKNRRWAIAKTVCPLLFFSQTRFWPSVTGDVRMIDPRKVSLLRAI